MSRLVNDVTVTYTGGTISKQDPASISQFGYWHRDYTLNTTNATAADAYATQLLRNAYPTYHMESLTFDYHNLSASDRAWLLGTMLPGKVIELAWTNTRYTTANPIQLIVQGWQWTLGHLDAEITLNLSDYAGAVGSAAWQNITTGITWLTISPTQTWQQIGVLL